MITLLSLHFWFHFLVFIFGSFVAFYIPGSLVLSHLNLRKSHFVIFSMVIGIALFVWQANIFGYLGFRNMSYVYLIIGFFWWILRLKINKFNFIKDLMESIRNKVDWVLIGILLIGLLIQLIPIFGFGLETSKGIHYCCGNSSDYFFHLSLSRSLMDNFPAFQPGMYGVEVTNYHYWSNLVASEFARIFKTPLELIQFQFTPLLISLLYAGSVIAVGQLLSVSKAFTRIFTLFMLLSGDAIFFVLLFLGKGFSEFRLMSSLEDATKFWVNPPRAFSLLIISAALYFLIFSFKNKKENVLSFAIFCVLGATATGFKVYLGIFHGLGLSILFMLFLLQKKWKYLFLTLMSYILTAVVFLPSNSQSGGLFLAPFHIARDFVSQKPLGLIRLEMARQIFYQDEKYIKALFFDLIYTIIFSVSTFGIKLFAIAQSLKNIAIFPIELTLYLLFGILISFAIGLFSLQSSGGANTFNFVVSSWYMISFFSALGVFYILGKIRTKKLKSVFLFIVVLLLISRTFDETLLTIKRYFKYEMILSREEKNFYKKVEKLDKGFMVVDPEINPDRTAPYIFVQTGQRMFLSGEGILRSHNVVDLNRVQTINYIFRSDNSSIVANEIYQNNIEYILMYKDHKIPATESALFVNKILDEGGMYLYSVDQNSLVKFLKAKKLP